MNGSLGWSLVRNTLLVACAGILAACGGGGGSNSSVSDVAPVSNVAPVANNDAGTVSEGGVTSINVAANDTDAEGALDLASISVVSAPSSGSPVVNADGTISYIHDGSAATADSFTYTISDTSSATSNEATVNVTVTPSDDGAPVAGDIAATLDEGSTTDIDIAANVTEGDNALDLTSLAIFSGPNSGSVVDNGDGSVDYTHDGSETVNDSFSYTIADISGAPSNVATVNLTITPVNDAPTLSGIPASVVGEGGFYSFVPTAADADPNDTLIFSFNTKPDWADFNTATGALAGAPGSADVGTTTTGIVITVDDQQGQPNSKTSLPAFDLSVVEGFNEALFATPVVSSSTTVEGKFQANDGDPATTWVADVGDSSPSVQLDFDNPKLIYRVTLSDLPASGDRLIAGVMEFSDGSSQAIPTLPDNGAPQELFFEPRQTDWIKVSLTQTTGASGLAEIAAYSTLDPDQSEISRDLFNDNNATGWSVTNNCIKAGTSSNWGVGISTIGISPEAYTPEAYQQTGDCRGFSPDGLELGSYSVYSVPAVAAGMDLRLRILAGDTSANWTDGTIGVLFGYLDDDNYYRLDISGLGGHRKLWKKQGESFSELNTSPQNYTLGKWFNLRVVQKNGIVLVYMDGEKIMAVQNASFSAGKIALLCARNESCNFDNVFILDPPSAPSVGMNVADGSGHSSGEYFVSTGGTLDVSAVVTDGTGISGVEFVVDEGVAAEISETDISLPYGAQFNFTAAGNHDIRSYLLDSSLQRLPDSGAVHELPQIGVNGIHLVGMGDSITSGLEDDEPIDDISADGRNTGRGYQSILNDLLAAANGSKPVTVLDEGNPGETSGEAATRRDAVLNRTPAVQGYLLLYGANDSGGGTPASKAVFKANMQQIIDTFRADGKEIYLAKAPPHLGSATRDALIQDYNDAIQELVDDSNNGFSGYTPPDFHTFFTNRPQEMADDLHPNGIGYQSMARMWCESLNGQAGMLCTP